MKECKMIDCPNERYQIEAEALKKAMKKQERRTAVLFVLMAVASVATLIALLLADSARAHDTGGWPWVPLADCESGDGDGRAPYRATWNYNGSSGFDGGLQFKPSTWSSWRRAGEPRYAYQAPAWQQIVVARRVLRDQGWGAWPECSRKIGLR